MIKLKDILQEISTNASPKKIGNWKANKLFNPNKEKEQEEIAIENTKEGKKLEKVITKIMKSKIDPEIVDEYVSTIYHGGTPKNKKIDALGGTMIKDLIDALLNKDIESDEIDDFIADAMMNSQD